MKRAGLSIIEWCAAVGIARPTFYTLTKESKPRTVNVGKKVLVTESSEEWLARVGKAGGAETQKYQTQVRIRTGTQARVTNAPLRDYFAAAALQGILANPAWTNRPDKVDGDEERAAFEHADAMLAERVKP